MKKPAQAGQDTGAGTAPTSSLTPNPHPTAGPAPKFCPSCGKAVHSFRNGNATYCEGCKHVFDEHGQGRPADFMDRLERLEASVSAGARDPRVDNLDGMVRKISEQLTGKSQGIEDLDPDNPDQVGKLSAGLAAAKAMFGAFFKPRAKPAAPAAAPPAQGGK